jgi:branched-chain amino acid aminotransferase
MELADRDTVVSINGKLTPPEEATVSVFDRGFLYGDSIYEVVLTYEKTPFLLDEHLNRLWNSAAGIGLEMRLTRPEIKQYIDAGLKEMDQERLYIRIIITRGAGVIGLDPSLSDGQNVYIIFRNLPPLDETPYKEGVKLVTTDVIRNSKDNVDPAVKSGNYLNNVLALQAARKKGGYDAVMLNTLGNVTESSTSNIWIVEGNRYITPPLSAGLLGGITRASLIEIGKTQGLEVLEQDFDLKRLKSASEVFITSSTREVMPVIKVDGSTIGNGRPGPNYMKLHAYYKDYVRQKISDHH